MIENLSKSLTNVPVENEEFTPETIATIQRAVSSLDNGDSISHEEILREFRNERQGAASVHETRK